MNDLISRAAVLKLIAKMEAEYWGEDLLLDSLYEQVEEMPSAVKYVPRDDISCMNPDGAF